MLKTSLLEILRTFSKDEFKRFDEFVHSPYFNKKSTVTRLWGEVKKFSPEFENENLDRKLIWKKLFPDKEFNYGVMKNLIYSLTLLIERFLEEELFAKDEYNRGIHLLTNLSSKDLNKILESEYKVLFSKINNSKHGPVKYEKLAGLKWQYYSFLDNMDKKNRENIFEISEYTIYSFLITLFKIYNNIYAEKITVQDSKDPNLLEKFVNNLDLDSTMEIIKSRSKEDYKIVSLYFDMYKAFKENNSPDSFYKFKDNLVENDNLLLDYERRNLFACLFTTLTFNETIKNKPKENNELNRIIHSKKIMTDENGIISVRDFSFGVRMAAMAKDIEFLEEFINTYTKALRPSTVENMSLYGAAYLHFAKGEFSKALELVNRIDFYLLSFKVELKNLQLMLFYELNDPDSLLYSMDSYRHFAINNQFVSEPVRKKIFRFINYLNSLIKLKADPDKTEIEYLKDKIVKDTLNTKYWLLEKIDALKE